MELGPISGIRSVTLQQARRAEQGVMPPVVINATAATGDEPGSSGQQSSKREQEDRGHDPSEQDNSLEEQAVEAVELATENDHEPNRSEDTTLSGHDWFV